ncbi:MAG: 50S ribosomal protein L10 [Solirubrobacterales bacterium]
MNRDEKAAFIDDVKARVEDSDAIFAVDYRGITVSQAGELRGKLGEADASFQVVKNTLTRIALDRAGEDGKVGTVDLKAFLEGPTAFTYVKGDVALAAKTIAGFTKEYEILAYKGGIMDGQVVSVDQFTTLTKLPARDVLYGQLVGMVAAPLSGLVRTLNALISGLAIQLGQIAERGLVTGEAPAAASAPADAAEAPDAEATEQSGDAEAPEEEAATTDEAEASSESPADASSGEAGDGPSDSAQEPDQGSSDAATTDES